MQIAHIGGCLYPALVRRLIDLFNDVLDGWLWYRLDNLVFFNVIFVFDSFRTGNLARGYIEDLVL